MKHSPAVSERIIVFADLQGYHRQICSRLGPAETFDFLSDFYAIAQRTVDGSEGQIVKFIGDAILLLFPASNPSLAIDTLQALKTNLDSFLSSTGYNSRLCIKAHLGTVATGRIGEGALERFDVAGLPVNETALLPNDEWVLSEALQQRLEAWKPA